MKVKYLKELNIEETQLFRSSELFEIINQDWATTDSFIKYNREYFGGNYIDYSLVVFEGSIFYIGMYSFSSENTISFFNQPVKIFNLNINAKNLSLAFIAFYQKLSEIKVTSNISMFYFYTQPEVLSKFIDNQISTEVEMESYIDLSQSEDLIRMNVRKSYKSLINWGITNLKMVIIDRSNPDKERFDSFKNLHIHVAGKQTRSNLSWDLQFDEILNNEAFLILGYLNEKLVSGAFIIYGSKTAYYGVAVNDRELMAKNLPIGHSILFSSIIHAKEKGIKLFILGNIGITTDEKVNDIVKYKKGFTNTVEAKTKHLVQL